MKKLQPKLKFCCFFIGILSQFFFFKGLQGIVFSTILLSKRDFTEETVCEILFQ